MFKGKKGQSILEYVIILIAIVACIAWAATEFIAKGSLTAPKGVGTLMQQAGVTIKNYTEKIGKIGQ